MTSMSQLLIESLAVRTMCLTLCGGRLLLDLEGCLLPYPPAEVKLRRRAGSLVSRGVAFARLGLWADAIRRWRKAIALNPESSDARNNLAVAYELSGKHSWATGEYERALAVEATNIYIEQNYQLHQEAMTIQGRKEEPKETFEMRSRH